MMKDDTRAPKRALAMGDFFRENRRLLLGALAFAVASAIADLVVRASHLAF